MEAKGQIERSILSLNGLLALIIMKWIKNVFLTVFFVSVFFVGIVLLAKASLYIREYVPSTVKSEIMEQRFGFANYFSNLPSFKVTKYKRSIGRYGVRFGLRDGKPIIPSDHSVIFEYRLRFKDPLDDIMIAQMDSLVKADNQHSISGWRYDESKKAYYYFFDDIAKDVYDTLFFSLDRESAVFKREVN